MEFRTINRDDIQKYYCGSYLKFHGHGDLLFYIEGCDRNMVYGKVEDGRDLKLYIDDAHPYHVDYILPHKAFFQYEQHAVLLERIPAKQYHRGITTANTKMGYLARDGGASFMNQLPIGFNTLKAFVSKQKPFSLSDAVVSKYTSCVLSPRMMYMPMNKYIYVDFEIVGSVSDKTITMKKKLFTYEVLQILKDNNESHLWSVQ